MMKNLGQIIDIPKIADPRGNLTVVQQMEQIPFKISRAYWIYDVPSGEHRGGHAHKHCREFIVAVSGSFTVTLDNSVERRSFLLNHPYQGLLVETEVWRTLDDFSSGAVCLVLAEDDFDEDDYIREYADYVAYLKMGAGDGAGV
jgi:mannose-6-phosphate isomerase-like protein (cupin superfamily)